MIYKRVLCKNGDVNYWYYYYKCDICDEVLEESFPIYKLENRHLCVDCAFKNKIINQEKYANLNGIYLKNIKVGINPIDNKIEITTNKKFSWEKKNKDYRKSVLYKEWRKFVFERDNYTCKLCNKIGEELEAHHIKYFKDYKDLRYDLNNGITLCKKCHRELHKQERNKK